MEIIYKTKDGMEFSDKGQAEKWESLERVKIEKQHIEVEKIKVIPPSQLKTIFEIGDVTSMCLVYRDDGIVKYDSDYETFSLDETGHLDCTDYYHGLFEWSESEQSYVRVYHGKSWKVEFLGVESVSYY